MIVIASDKGLCALEFKRSSRNGIWERRMDDWFSHFEDRPGVNEHIESTEEWLHCYFAKKWRSLPKVTFDQRGTTFELKVWRAMLKIPLGETRTYGEIAGVVGSPKGARAVGAASRRNPISLIVPCHRIIGAASVLTGYGGGLENKQFLLEHEGWSPAAKKL